MKDFLQVIFKTLNFLDDYTNEFCQQKKVCSAKKKKKKKNRSPFKQHACKLQEF